MEDDNDAIVEFIESRLTTDEHFKLVFEDMSEESWRAHFRAMVKKFGRDGVHYLERLRNPDSMTRNVAAADVAKEWRDHRKAFHSNVSISISIIALVISILVAFFK